MLSEKKPTVRRLVAWGWSGRRGWGDGTVLRLVRAVTECVYLPKL